MEFASLTDAMNQMAAQLDDRIKTALSQRNELEAVLICSIKNNGREILFAANRRV